MAFRLDKIKTEDTVEYKVYPVTITDSSNETIHELLNEIFISLKTYLNRYIWQNESLHLHPLNTG